MRSLGIIILAAGKGTRLRPLTNKLPKILLKINNKKVIDYAFETFEKLNFSNKEYLINASYKKELVTKHILKKKNLNITIYKEKKLRGSLGTLFDNLKWIKKKDIIILHYGDVIFDKKVIKTLIWMLKSKYKSRMIVDIRNNANQSGIVKFNSKRELTSFIEKPEKMIGKQYVNSGLYVFDKNFLVSNMKLISKKINIDTKLDFSYEFSEFLLKKTKIFLFKNNVLDIGTIKNFNKAKKIFRNW